MFCVVLVMVKDEQEAKLIAHELVKEKLVACANILNGVTSIFQWEGKIDEAKEVLMVLKTKQDLFDAVIQKVKSLHSYKVPEIIALPIIGGDEDYLQWVQDSVQ